MAIHYSPEDRLQILRASDVSRKWYSLDDKRVCVLCDRVITGRQVEIKKHRGTATPHCPTPGCEGTPREWFYHASASSAARVARATGKSEFSFL